MNLRNHAGLLHPELTAAAIKNTASSFNQPRIEEVLSTLPSNSRRKENHFYALRWVEKMLLIYFGREFINSGLNHYLVSEKKKSSC